MRDPDLVRRAQLAAAELEHAWYRWRVTGGLVTDPMPTVSSYVGYSLEEPWGQPRVVFGIAAEDAEQLAGLLTRHDCAVPGHADATSGQLGQVAEPQAVPAPTVERAVQADGVRLAAQTASAGGERRAIRAAVPPQAPSKASEQPVGGKDGPAKRQRPVGRAPRAFGDVADEGDGPVFRQIASAQRRATEERAAGSDVVGSDVAGTGSAEPEQASPVQAVQASPVQASPVQASPVQAVQASPVQASPVQASPVQASPVQASPVQASPVQAVQASPVQASPVQASPAQASPVQASPVQASPVRATVQASPVRAEPARGTKPAGAGRAGAAPALAGPKVAAAAGVNEGGRASGPASRSAAERPVSARGDADVAADEPGSQEAAGTEVAERRSPGRPTGEAQVGADRAATGAARSAAGNGRRAGAATAAVDPAGPAVAGAVAPDAAVADAVMVVDPGPGGAAPAKVAADARPGGAAPAKVAADAGPAGLEPAAAEAAATAEPELAPANAQPAEAGSRRADARHAGPWAAAASTARAEAEARIRANFRGGARQDRPAARQADSGPAEHEALDGATEGRHRMPGIASAWGGPEFDVAGQPDQGHTQARQPGSRHRVAAAEADADQPGPGTADAVPGTHARRGRMTRGYPIPRLSRAKRPGAVPGL